MCILCVVQKWARRVATMLPWLVIPLIGLWLLSQLLPPAFRFEITSPRLACVSVLLVTLFWYEILMPQLSTWRARSNARQRERKRFEAIELQKLRKTATRRCRNCLTPYRDQNPGGGKFMCSYCGHLSKRPVLDLPVPPGLGRSNSGILKDLVGKGGKILNGKAWSDNAWMCGRQEWLENGDWVGGSFTGNSSYRRYGTGLFTGENDCPAENSFLCIFIFVCKSFATLPFSIMWLWRKVFKINPSGLDSASDMEGTGALDQRGDNMGNCHQSKGDKARRKAEEKRQARLEKELMEEEERKQREEVARLVEERRKLRGETIEVEKEHVKGSPPHKGRESKREAEKKRGERKKERDRLSSRSNSDAEEFERRASKESDRYKKSEYDRRENHRGGSENVRARGTEAAYVSKGFLVNNSHGYSGTRYLDRVKGTLLSSSRAFTGGGFFGKSLNTTVCREQKTNFLTDHGQTSVNRREVSHPDRLSGRLSTAGDDKNISCPVPIESHSSSPSKKSWQQLFTRSSSVSPPSSSNVISKPNDISQSEVQSPPVTSNSTTAQPFGNPINVGLPSPFVTSSLSFGISTSSGFPLLSDSMLSPIGKPSKQYSSEEPEDFGDPCYVPEMVSLLGPVSESLGLGAENEPRKAADLKDIPASTEVVRPSPIESPMSRLRISEERNINPFSFQSIPAASQDVHNIDRSNNIDEAKTWQMWSSSPLVQNDLGLLGGTASWILPEVVNKPKSEEILHTGPPRTTASLFTGDDHPFYGTHYPQKVFNGSIQNGGMLNIPLPGGGGSDVSWLPKTSYGPVSGREEDHFSVKPVEDAKKNGNIFRYSNSNHQSEVPVANFWPKKDDDNVKGGSTRMSNNGSSPTLGKPHIGGLYSNPDVQSLWSYD